MSIKEEEVANDYDYTINQKKIIKYQHISIEVPYS